MNKSSGHELFIIIQKQAGDSRNWALGGAETGDCVSLSIQTHEGKPGNRPGVLLSAADLTGPPLECREHFSGLCTSTYKANRV